MFKKIVCATDGSDAADKALDLARQIATEAGGAVLVVHCKELTLPGKGGGSLSVAANEDELLAKIQGQAAELSEAGVPATLQTGTASVGGAAHAIAEAARENNADLIVVGTRGHTALGGLLLGSVTNRLLHITPCPVLAVPARGHSDT